ncbi:hypothetical protein RND81_12G091200 [Saponaria officinalis]|uniref:DNA replication complex GINS protein SLD5 n=1 Tax=Saponaria officinalis TaxID=3572 RepID=A0AAW1H8E2_SAPOF
MANESGISMDDYESLMATSDVELLKKAWRDEKSAPQILHFQAPLVQRSYEQIQLMEETIKEITGSGFDPLIVSIYQMDLNRALYLLKSYLRIRLHKIEKDVIHISKTDLWDRLSEQEQRFTKRCYDSMKNYVDESVLSKLPIGYQSNLKQSNASEEDDMVPEPNLDTFVFCKSEGSIGSIPLDDSADEIVDLVAGDLYVLRYKSIKTYVENGQIDLV